MTPFSTVIVCRNEAGIIGSTLASLAGVCDDVVVYDSGSTDGTQEVVRRFPVRLVEGPWEGFGPTKTKANALARHDWILSLDADEALDETLQQSLKQWEAGHEKEVYNLRFRNFLGDTPLRFGEWGKDHHIRLFHRGAVHWDAAPVHEELVLPPDAVVKKMNGLVLHRTVRDMDDYALKMQRYAMLNAEKYFRRGKKAGWFKLRLSPGFTFFHYYILRGGFLDGQAGYLCARMTAYYTFLKYARLYELQRNAATTGTA